MSLMSMAECTAGVRSGKPSFIGTRIAVYDVLECLAAGMTTDEIVTVFPELTGDHIRAALEFAAGTSASWMAGQVRQLSRQGDRLRGPDRGRCAGEDRDGDHRSEQLRSSVLARKTSWPTREWQMNRRDALRKIGTGSAVLAGASVVVSQPAFAFSGPNGATAATLMAVRRNNRRVDMTVSPLGITQCSGSSIGSSQEFVDVTATEFALTGNAFLQLAPFNGSGGPALPETTDQSTFSVRRVGSGGGGGGVNRNRFQVNDAFDIALRIRHTCTYTGPGTGSAIFTTVYRVTWDGTNPQTTLISSP